MSELGALPKGYQLRGEFVRSCAYGENPWQSPAGLYMSDESDPLAIHRFKAVSGRDPSFINTTDLHRALLTLTHIAAVMDLNYDGQVPHMAIAVKHGNACGAAIGSDPAYVLKRMVMGDPLAVFGATVMTNFGITAELARTLKTHRATSKNPRLFDVLAAPAVDEEACSILARKDGKYAHLQNPALAELSAGSLDLQPLIRQVRGGFMLQPNYTHILDHQRFELHGRVPTQLQYWDILMAWAICATSNSNTVTVVKHGQLIGNGVGQQDRKRCCELAVKRALDSGHKLYGSCAASDSFFPAPDGPEVLAQAGVKAIFASGGSRADKKVIELCKRYGVKLAMQADAEVRSFAHH